MGTCLSAICADADARQQSAIRNSPQTKQKKYVFLLLQYAYQLVINVINSLDKVNGPATGASEPARTSKKTPHTVEERVGGSSHPRRRGNKSPTRKGKQNSVQAGVRSCGMQQSSGGRARRGGTRARQTVYVYGNVINLGGNANFILGVRR